MKTKLTYKEFTEMWAKATNVCCSNILTVGIKDEDQMEDIEMDKLSELSQYIFIRLNNGKHIILQSTFKQNKYDQKVLYKYAVVTKNKQ